MAQRNSDTTSQWTIPGWIISMLGVIGIVLLGELLTRTNVLPNQYFPYPSATFEVLFQQLRGEALWSAIWQTLRGWAFGLGIAAILAIPIGLLIGSSQLVYRTVKVAIEFLRPVPSVALIPLAILIYGVGIEMKTFLAAFASFWPLLFQTIYGVQDVDQVARDTARAYGMGRLNYSLFVVLPSASPYIATGLRISSAIALILSITGELVVGAPGLGRAINAAQLGGDPPLTYALISVAGILGYVLNEAFQRIESRVLHWHTSQRGQEVQ